MYYVLYYIIYKRTKIEYHVEKWWCILFIIIFYCLILQKKKKLIIIINTTKYWFAIAIIKLVLAH
jgi:hypothetical protein